MRRKSEIYFKLWLCWILVFIPGVIFPQTGIGTVTSLPPGVALNMESANGGFLMTRVALTARNVQAPVTGNIQTGTLVYNTNTSGVSPNQVTPGFYWWDGEDNSWKPLSNPKPRDIVKFRNGTTNIDFNNGTNYMDIFHTLDFNENTTLYEKVNNTTLAINDTGLFRMTLNLDMWTTDSDRDLAGLRFTLNGISTVISELVFIPTPERRSVTTETTAKTVVIYFVVPQGGADLKLQGYEINGSAEIFFRAVQTSFITIERVK